MGSETSLGLQVIDFSNPDLGPATSDWESIKSQVGKALEGYGCFQVKYKGEISSELEEEVFNCWKELFDLPLEVKMRYASDDYFSGYLAQLSHMPLNEAIGIDDPTTLENVESFARIFWPDGNPKFSKAMLSYANEVSGLERTVRRMILEILGIDQMKLDEHMASTKYVMRGLKYRAPQNEEHATGLASHIDKNLVTILRQYQVNGLQVQDKVGEWVDVTFGPNSFVVIPGESLYAWTNGRVQPPWHRVTMAGNVARYSIGLFTLFKPGFQVKSPKELVDEQHPSKYRPFDFYEFLKLRRQQNQHYAPIEDYFGVSNTK